MSITDEISKIMKPAENVVRDIEKQVEWSGNNETSLLCFIVSPNLITSDEIKNKLENNLRKICAINTIDLSMPGDLFSRLKDEATNLIFGVHKQPEIVRKLNWQRERFILSNLRCVFVISYFEYVDIVERAPDFWDFRNSLSFVESAALSSLVADYVVAPRIKVDISEERQNAIVDAINSSREIVEDELAENALRLITSYIAMGDIQKAHTLAARLKQSDSSPLRHNIHVSLESFFENYGSKTYHHIVNKLIRNEESYTVRVIGNLLLSRYYFYIKGSDEKSAMTLRKAFQEASNEGDISLAKSIVGELRSRYLLGSMVDESFKIIDKFDELSKGTECNYVVLLKADNYVRLSDCSRAISMLSTFDDSDYTSNYRLVYRFLLCLAYFDIGENEKAEEIAIECVRVAKSIGEGQECIYSYTNAAKAALSRNDPVSARIYLEEAANFVSIAPEGISNLQCTLGNLDEFLKDKSGAIQKYKHAFNIADSAIDKLSAISSLFDVDDILDVLDSEELEYYIEEGRKAAGRVTAADMRYRYFYKIGTLFNKRMEYSRAVPYLRMSIKYFKDSGSKNILMFSAMRLATSLLSINEFKEAVKYFVIARDIAELNSFHRLSLNADAYLFVIAATKKSKMSSETLFKSMLRKMIDVELGEIISTIGFTYKSMERIGKKDIAEELRGLVVSFFIGSNSVSDGLGIMEQMGLSYLDVRTRFGLVYSPVKLADYLGADIAMGIINKFRDINRN